MKDAADVIVTENVDDGSPSAQPHASIQSAAVIQTSAAEVTMPADLAT